MRRPGIGGFHPPYGRIPIDWRGWLALAWAAWFGCLYVHMVLEERAPGVLRAIGGLVAP